MKKLDSSEFKISNNMIKSDYTLCNQNLTTTTTAKKDTKQVKILRKLFKILKSISFKMQEEKIQYTDQEILSVEWKELARRVEQIFLIISFCAIISIPILLFGKFFKRDLITKEHLKSSCGCQQSFVKNI
jgi:hypothetical protein